MANNPTTHISNSSQHALPKFLAVSGSALGLAAALVFSGGGAAFAAGTPGNPGDAPTSSAPASDEASSGAPSSDAPSGDAPSSDAPSSDAPSSDAPGSDSPSSDAPSSDAPSSDAPSSEAPSSEAPTSTAPSSTAPSSSAPTTSAPAQAKLSVSPKTISAKNFVKSKKGVMLAVSGLKPGASVVFTVQPKASKVKPFVLTVTANAKGVASWSVYGTNPDNPSAYLGTYGVTAKVPGGKTLTGQFKVVSSKSNPGGGGNGGGSGNGNGGGSGSGGGNGSGSGGNGGGSGNGTLPRTGTELYAAGFGAALLVVGAGVLMVTRRRRS